MSQNAEKPLLSDYEVLSDIDEKRPLTPETEEVITPAERHPGCQNCTSNDSTIEQRPRFQKLQKLGNLVMNIAKPISRKSVGFGCEPFVPQAADQECQKAARIINSFSYKAPNQSADALTATPSSEANATSTVDQHIVTIPPSVISNAVGLIIFTTGRLGLGHMSGSTGSGLLLVRSGDDHRGEWTAPVPVQTYSLGAGLLAFGAEVSDRVYVLNNKSAIELFKNARFEIGPEVVLAAGPYGGGGGVTFSGMSTPKKEGQEAAVQPACTCGDHPQQQNNDQGAFKGVRDSLAQPVYCYMRSRGLYAGLQAEGTVFVQHPEQSVPESEAAVLINALKAAEGISQ